MSTQQTMTFKKQVVRATFWLTSLTLFGQALTWGITIIVIRLLQPQDYGLMAMSAVFIGFLTTISEMGLGAAIIQQKDITHEQRRQAAGFVLLINTAIIIVLFFAAPLVAKFYKEERLISIILVLGVNFILIAGYTVPRSMMMRNMEFRRKSMIDLFGNLTNGAVVLVMALLDFGVWSLVAGIVSGHIFKAIVFNVASTYRCLPSFSFRGIRPMLTFGIHMTVTSILWYLYSQSDVMIGGRVLGKELIGFYAVSIQLVSLPISKITPLISQIGFSASARMQTEINSIKNNFLKLANLVNTVSFPLFIGFVLTAAEAVPVILGPKWRPAIVPMQILALIMPLRFLAALFPPLVNGMGYPHVNTGNMIYAVLIMPPAFFIGSHWGIIGFCLAWLIAFPLLFVIISTRSLRVMQLPMWAMLKTTVAPLTASIVMSMATVGVRTLAEHRLPKSALLVLLVVCGAVTYMAATFVCNRNIFKEVKAFAFAR